MKNASQRWVVGGQLMRGAGYHLVTVVAMVTSAVTARCQDPVIVTTAPAEANVKVAPAQPAPAASAPATAAEAKPPEGGGPSPGSAPPSADGTHPAAAPGQEGEKKPEAGKPAEAPKPVARPDKPTGPGNPEAFQVRPDSEGLLQFQFDGAPWPALIEWLGEVSGMAIDWQELPGDFINLRTQRRYTLAETRDLINRHLLARGYTLLQEGELLTVVKTESINTALVPRVSPEQLTKCLPHDFVKVSFELDWLLSEDAVHELKPLISKNGQLIALRNTNRLEAIDAARNLQQLQQILQDEQSPDSEERLLREFVLENVRATYVRDKLEQLLGVSKKPELTLPPELQAQQQQMQMQMQMQQQQMQQQQQQQQQQQGQPGAVLPQRKPTEVQIVVNEQRNSVIIQAPPDQMVVLADAVRLLDVPNRRGGSLDALVGSIRTYRLATLEPKEVVDILLETGVMDPDTRLKVDQKSRAIIVSGPPWDHLTVEKLIKKLDGSPRTFKVVRLRRRRADQVATTIESLMLGPQEDKQQNRRSYYYDDFWGRRNSDADKPQDRFRVGADVEHNWLLLWCNETEHERVTELLAELGEVPGSSARGDRVRVVETLDASSADDVLRRAREAFRSLAPNPVELPEPLPPAPDTSPPQAPPQQPAAPALPLPATDAAVPTVEQSRPVPDPVQTVSNRLPRIELAALTRLDVQPADAPNPRASTAGDAADPSQEPPAYSEDASSDAAESSAAPGQAPAPAPITVTRSPDGRIVIQSTDAAALDTFEELLEKLRPRTKDYQVFKLKHASASWVALNLEDFFEEKDEEENRWPFFFFSDDRSEEKEPLGLADRRPIRFISDIDTNTIVVRNATEDQLKTVEELVELYDVREPSNKEKSRHTKLISVKYSKASVIAAQIKDVFRDLLSGNDKAFQQANQPEQQQHSGGGLFAEGLAFGEGDSQTKSDTRASFKGKLSLGVDDATNTLLVSTEGETLMKLVSAMIEDLDRSARPADDVRIVRLRPGANTSEVRDALRGTLRISPGSPTARPAADGSSQEPSAQQPAQQQQPPASGDSPAAQEKE